jgi:putative ABC transport system permease protein
MLDALRQDLRDALRALTHSRRFAAWVIGSLAIGMAVTIAALAVLSAELALPFPHVFEQKRLVRLSVSRNCGRPDCWIRMSAPADYDALREGLRGLKGLAAYTSGEIAVALPEARSMLGMLASANYFDVLGVRAVVGRTFEPSDGSTHAAVAVIAHHAWTREFGGDPAIIGRSIRVGGQFVHIVGVAPPQFIGVDRIKPGNRSPDVWLPLWLADGVLPLTAAEQRREERDIAFVGRMKDDVEVAQIRAEAQVLAQRIAASRDGGAAGGLADVRRVWRVDPKNWHFGVIVVMPIPILVLVIACVNAANLMLARGSQRQREIAVRLAIGARRGRIIRQLLIESALLATGGIALAVPMAWMGLQVASNPLNVQVPFDQTVLALTVMTAVITTVAFGLAPAVRVSAQQPSTTLGSAGARDATPRQSRMRHLLIVAQVTLSLGLLATAWQLVATVRSQAVSGGTPADRLLIARFDLQPRKLASADVERFYGEVVAGATRLPGVEAAGLARYTSVWTFGQRTAAGALVVWHPNDAPEEGRVTIGGYAGGDLFAAVGVRILAGRGFTDADRRMRPQVAVVNETAARRMTGPVVGSFVRIAPRGHDIDSSIDVRIVGVIEPTIEPRLEQGEPPAPKLYLPSPIEPEPALALYIRTTDRATTIAQPVRELVSRIAPLVPIQELGSLAELNERSYGQQLWLARAAALVGVIGLLLATAGLYGVSSYIVAMRSREIAIRLAIGARPGVILAMIFGQSMRVAAIGLLAGGGAAIAISRFIQAEYHGIQGIDSTAFGGAVSLFLAAMLLASFIPAVRASRLDPVENLKEA